MHGLFRGFNWVRLCIAGVIFVTAFFLVTSVVVERIIFPMLVLPAYYAWSEPAFHIFEYALWFFELFFILLPGAIFYFWRVKTTFLQSLYLGIAFATSLYVFEVVHNWYVELFDPDKIYRIYASLPDSAVFILGTIVVTGFVHLLFSPRSAEEGEMRTF